MRIPRTEETRDPSISERVDRVGKRAANGVREGRGAWGSPTERHAAPRANRSSRRPCPGYDHVEARPIVVEERRAELAWVHRSAPAVESPYCVEELRSRMCEKRQSYGRHAETQQPFCGRCISDRNDWRSLSIFFSLPLVAIGACLLLNGHAIPIVIIREISCVNEWPMIKRCSRVVRGELCALAAARMVIRILIAWRFGSPLAGAGSQDGGSYCGVSSITG